MLVNQNYIEDVIFGGGRDTAKYRDILIKLLAYSWKDIKSYDELTPMEKSIIDESTFNEFTC